MFSQNGGLMSNIYSITLHKTDDYNLNINYSEEFKTMSNEDIAIALDDCIRLLKIELNLITQS